MTLYTWSKTAASNSSADASINWAEGQAPSSVNDSARAMMAAAAKYRDDNAGTLTTAGTATAYTLTSNQVFTTLGAMSGSCLRVKFHATNGASATLNVDGLGAKAIVTVTGSAVGTGSIAANSIYDLVYSNSTAEWILVGNAQIAGQAKCWAYITVSGGTPTLAASYNITSITDTDVGEVTITIATDFSSVNWVALALTNNMHTVGSLTSKTAGAIKIAAFGTDHLASDPGMYNFAGFGAQ